MSGKGFLPHSPLGLGCSRKVINEGLREEATALLTLGLSATGEVCGLAGGSCPILPRPLGAVGGGIGKAIFFPSPSRN